MTNLSGAGYGILLMMVNGILNTLMASAGKLLRQADYQYFRIMSVSDGMLVLVCVAGCVAGRVPLPGIRQAVWLFLRGFFGAASFLMLILAVRVGASPGDAAALGSINTVIAALFGRIFLGEPFGLAHSIAIACAVAGAVLISKPAFLFDSGPTGGNALLGYSLAGASGFTKACVFIAARKCTKASSWHLNLSPASFGFLAFVLLPLLPLIDEPKTTELQEPLCIVFIMVLFIAHATAMYSQGAASKFCKAAVGATSNTGAAMVSGYIIQTLFFDKAPELISVGGAALMFASVIIMAVTRVPGRQQTSCQDSDLASETHARGDAHTLPSEENDEDDSESLGSFISSEFVEHAPAEKKTDRKSVV